MHKLNEAVMRQVWLSNDERGAGHHPLTSCQHGWRRGGEKSIEIKSVHRESQIGQKLNHVKMMMMVKLNIRYISPS